MPRFADPLYFILAIVVIPLLWIYFNRRRQRRPAITFTALEVARKVVKTDYKRYIRFLPTITTLAALLLMVIAIARPQDVHEGEDIHTEGIDIVLVIDISSSMLARDFTPDRVGAAKDVAAEFIRERPDDRIAIVLFAKQAFTQCPLTIDHSILLELLDGVEIGLADPDNTAIGQALGAALNRLKASESKSKVVILMTDGENNFGLPPTTAAEAAEALGVSVYTIGVGSRGTAPYPARDMFGRTRIQNVRVSIDEDLLKEIAASTGGKYFRATNNDKLRKIFTEIDRMEKTKIEVRAYRRYSELFYSWISIALILLVFSVILSATILRGIV
ncbi:MAG: VWA domain-containing protein [Candidatus Hatepunaea meridiana]|nr:VWA domain-containing protein [Candidatus Hatepunaea meridiana]